MDSFAMRRLAGSRLQPAMMDNLACFALTCWAESQVGFTCCATSLGEVVIVPNRWRQRVAASGVASLWRNSAKSSCTPAYGTASHARRDKPALTKWISIPTLSLEITRKRGNEATASIIGAPERSESWRSNADYVARGVRGDPRGRKSGAGLGVANPRWPARAEGEKRFRSATRNP
jgi:hypothetical protein